MWLSQVHLTKDYLYGKVGIGQVAHKGLLFKNNLFRQLQIDGDSEKMPEKGPKTHLRNGVTMTHLVFIENPCIALMGLAAADLLTEFSIWLGIWSIIHRYLPKVQI